MKMTPGRIRALEAVRDGKVVNRFDADGNVFVCPKGVSPRVCRQLQNERLIKDVPRQKTYGRFFTQMLTVAGWSALRESTP